MSGRASWQQWVVAGGESDMQLCPLQELQQSSAEFDRSSFAYMQQQQS
jgi:hypothetical protein